MLFVCEIDFVRTSQRWLAVALLLATFFATGCKVGPDYMKPCAPVKDAWSHAAHPKLNGQPDDTNLWWNYFGDPQLNQVVYQAYQQNLTLREAGMRIEEARNQVDIARGNLFPQTQSIVGSHTKSQTSRNRANVFLFPNSPVTLSPSNWLLGFDASWELDFWGRFRRSVAAADAQLDSTVENYDDVLVILIGDVAATYIDMRTQERRLDLARENVQIQKETLRIVTNIVDAGRGSPIDIAQAELNLGQTEALIPALEILRRQASNRLCLLLGEPSRDLKLDLGTTAKIPDPPSHVATGVPADLLRRRPDVRRAERELAAQSERIGIAMAEFYPHIAVNGNINIEAQDFSKLFQPSSLSGVIAPQFRWNILNYGRLKANVAGQDAAFQRLAYAYQNAVLRADREAEDAMVAYLQGHERVAAFDRAVKRAKLLFDKEKIRRDVGVGDPQKLLLVQRDFVNQQDALAAAQGEVARSLVALFKAMGGGWEIRLLTSDEEFVTRLPPPEPIDVPQPQPQPQRAPMPAEIK